MINRIVFFICILFFSTPAYSYEGEWIVEKTIQELNQKARINDQLIEEGCVLAGSNFIIDMNEIVYGKKTLNDANYRILTARLEKYNLPSNGKSLGYYVIFTTLYPKVAKDEIVRRKYIQNYTLALQQKAQVISNNQEGIIYWAAAEFSPTVLKSISDKSSNSVQGNIRHEFLTHSGVLLGNSLSNSTVQSSLKLLNDFDYGTGRDLSHFETWNLNRIRHIYEIATEKFSLQTFHEDEQSHVYDINSSLWIDQLKSGSISNNKYFEDIAGLFPDATETDIIESIKKIYTANQQEPRVNLKVFTTSSGFIEPMTLESNTVFNGLPETNKHKTAIQKCFEYDIPDNQYDFLVIGLHFFKNSDGTIKLQWAVNFGSPELKEELEEDIFSDLIKPLINAKTSQGATVVFAEGIQELYEIGTTWALIKRMYHEGVLPELWNSDKYPQTAVFEPIVAGLLNGTWDELKGIPDLSVFLFKYIFNLDNTQYHTNQSIHSLFTSTVLWEKLWSGLCKGANDIWALNIQGQYNIGYCVPPILSLCVGYGVITKASKAGTLINTLTDVTVLVSKLTTVSRSVSTSIALFTKLKKIDGLLTEIVDNGDGITIFKYKGEEIARSVDDGSSTLLVLKEEKLLSLEQGQQWEEVLEEFSGGTLIQSPTGDLIPAEKVKLVRKGDEVGYWVEKVVDPVADLVNYPRLRLFLGDGQVKAYLNGQQLYEFENILKTADAKVLKTINEFKSADEFVEMLRGYKDQPKAFTEAIQNYELFNGSYGWLSFWRLTPLMEKSLLTIKQLKNENKLENFGDATDIQLASIHAYTTNGDFINIPYRYQPDWFGAYNKRAIRHINEGLDKLRKLNNRLYKGDVYSGKTFSKLDFESKFVGKSNTIHPYMGYMSTSKSESVAEGFIELTKKWSSGNGENVAVIQRIISKNGVYIDDISDWGKNLGKTNHSSANPKVQIQDEVLLNSQKLMQISEPIPIMQNGKQKLIDGMKAYYVDFIEIL